MNFQFKEMFRRHPRRRGATVSRSHSAEVLEQRSLLSAVTSYDIDVGEPFAPVELGDSVYFVGENAGGGSSLHALTNGVERLVYDLGEVGSPKIVVLNDTLFFPVQTAADGVELYESDGTVGGTHLLNDIRPGADSALTLAFWEDTVVYNNNLIFTADDGIHGVEIWTSDGTETGTRLLKDIRPFGFSSSGPRDYSFGKEGVFFRANDGVHGTELWVTDGTTEGTSIRANLTPGIDSSRLRFVNESPDGVFVIQDDGAAWFATTPEEFPIRVSNDKPIEAIRFHDDLFVMAGNGIFVDRFGDGNDSWTTHRPYDGQTRGGGFHGVMNDRLIFSVGKSKSTPDGAGNHEVGADYSLFSTNGSDLELIREFAFEEIFGTGEFYPTEPIQFEHVQYNGEMLYSGFENGSYGLWATDGTTAGNRFVALSETSAATAPRDFVEHENRIWFLSDDLLYSTDGTTDGTVQESNKFFPDSQPFSTSEGLLLATTDQLHAFLSGPPAAPAFTTPQSSIDGIVEWEDAPESDFYEVYQARSGDVPTNPNFVFDRTTDPSTIVEPWGQMQVYVRSARIAANGNPLTSDWTRGIFFNTNSLPILQSPVEGQLAEQFHGTDFNQLGVEFQFDAEEFVQFQSYLPDDPTTPVGGKNFIDDTTRIVFPSTGTFLYRFRQHSGHDGNGGGIRYSQWSGYYTIHVISDGTKLITPDVEPDSKRPTFRWTRYFGSAHSHSQNAADRYTLQVANRTTGDDRILYVEDLNALEYTPDFDLTAGNYEAWVLPKNGGNPIGWSQPITFSIGMQLTGVSPEGQIDTQTPTIRWDAIDIDAKYEVWINKQGGPSGIVRADNLLTNSFEITQPLDEGLYRVWVRARFGGGTRTQWSVPVTFTIGDRVVPQIVGPGGPGTDNTPSFEWVGPSSATHWKLQIRDLNTGQDIVIPPAEITSTSYLPTDDLPDSRYTVWVRGYAGDEPVTIWSPPQKFSIGEFPALSCPDPVVVRDIPIMFQWSPVANAVRYEFLARHVQAKRDAVHLDDLTELSLSLAYQIPTGTYRTWVRAIMADGSTTRWSEQVGFTVIDEIRYWQ